MMKKWLSLAFGIVVFACLAFFITGWITRTCIPFNKKADKIEKTLYSDDEDMNEVDICFIGGSHGLNAFNPNTMWDHAGLHSYNYCYAGETIPLTTAYLEELYKKRSFDLVVVDAYYAGLADPYFGEKDYAYDVLCRMKSSDGKSKYIDEHVREENKKDYVFPLNRYHSRWLDLGDNDVERKPDPNDDFMLGQDYHYEKNNGKTVRFPTWCDSGISVPLRDNIEDELRELIRTVKAHGSQMLIADIPRCYNAGAPAEWVDDEYGAVNRIKEIASEYDVKVLQFDEEGLDSIGFIPEKHMFNSGHMNIIGSEVYTKALADYIVKNYNVKRYEKKSGDIWEGYLGIYNAERLKHGVS